MRNADETVTGKFSPEIIHTFTEQFSNSRLAVETFIGKGYAAAFGATLTSFMPRLFALHSSTGELVASLGMRPASHPLFLERYLDHPIEVMLSDALGISVQRREIVEVGHFAGTGAGAARAVIKQMTASLFHEGFKWVAFTGTAGLRNAFSRLGLNPLDLAPADPMRLNRSERLLWGSYYKEMPRVQFGDITAGFEVLEHISDVTNHSVRKVQL